jgi:Cof subfamily protein (haloacid dehalogenase superfamily)
MNYKALAIDLDGTLLVGENLPEAHRRAVADASRAGLEIIIATARWRQMAERIGQRIGVVSPVIACNGAQVYVPGLGDVFDHRLPYDFVSELYELCNRESCLATVVVDELVMLKLDKMLDASMLPEEMNWVSRLDARGHALPRMVAVRGPIVSETIKRELKPKYAHSINAYDAIGPSGSSIVTITAKAANKGEALIASCRHLDISPSEVIAFGDSENDIAMFNVAGVSVAMGQATAPVKAAAGIITGANTENGVATIIDQLLSTGTI